MTGREFTTMELNGDGTVSVFAVRLVKILPAGAVNLAAGECVEKDSPAGGRLSVGNTAAPSSALERQLAALQGDGAPIEGTPISTTDPRLIFVMFDKARWTNSAARKLMAEWLSVTRDGKKRRAKVPKQLRSPVPGDGITAAELQEWIYFKANGLQKFEPESLVCIDLPGGIVLVIGDRVGAKYRPLGKVAEIPGTRKCEV